MKICMISAHPSSGGGVSSYTKSLVQSLRENKVDIIVFSNKPEKAELKEVDRSILTCWNKGVLYPFQIFKALRSSRDVNLIHLQHEFFLYGGMISAILFPVLLALIRLLGKPVVTTIHGVIPMYELNDRFKEENELSGPVPLLKFGLIFLTRVIVYLSDAVIVHGTFFAETLCHGYRCPKWKIHVITHGVEKTTTKIAQSEAKKRLRLEHKVIVLFFGYIARYKGIETLIEAFGRLTKKHQDWVLIIGGGQHPRLRLNIKYEEYVTKLQQMARSLAPGKTIFTGFIPDKELPLYFSAADTLVFPYVTAMSSSGPLALSMSFGKPVIASDIPPIRELIPFEEILVKRSSSEDIIKKLQLLLDSYDLRRRIAVHVRRMGEQNSWSNVGLQTYLLYQKVCKSPSETKAI